MARAWTDEEILQMLHLRDHEGLSGTEIAKRFGVGRSAVLGIFHRIKEAEAACAIGETLDGTMPPKWWTKRKAHT